MNEVYYLLPVYVDDIIQTLSKRDWLVHNFNAVKNDEIYNPSNYLYNAEFEGTKYVLIFDLNIYQFLLNSVKKNNPRKITRDAVALLVFCQVANIDIDPTFAVYEKTNYNEANIAEVISELELFHNINNSEIDGLAQYALEFADQIDITASVTINQVQMRDKLMRYKKLVEWDSLYLMMLSIVNIKYDDSVPADKKLSTFLDWLVRDFRVSLVATIYAMVLFGKKPIRRMMKYKASQKSEDRKKAVWNMTWDLYIMNQFFKKWTEKNIKEEFIFASDDNAFCELLRMAVEVQKQQNFDSMVTYLTDSGYEEAKRFLVTDKKI